MAGMNGTQIYDNFTAGQPEILQVTGDSIMDLNKGYALTAQSIVQLQQQMAQSWTGASGDAANAGAGPLASAFHDSAYPLDTTTNAMSTQSGSLDTAKASVVPVPPAPEKPSPWSTVLKAAIPVVGPGMAASDINSYQQGMDAHNAANDTNVRVMDQYSGATTSAQSTIPSSYAPLPLDGTSVGIKPATPNVAGGQVTSTYSGPGSTSSVTGSSPISGFSPSNPVSAPPNLGGTNPIPVGGTPPSSGIPISGPITGSPARGGTGTPGGYPIGIGEGVGGGKGGRGRTTGTGSGSESSGPGKGGGSGRGSAADRLLGSDEENASRRGGSASGRGGIGGSAEQERLGRSAAGGESGSKVGGGARTGGGGFGPGAAAEEAAAGRGGGARGGASGAPMGAGGGRGQGGEDEEHQRPDYLLEADPDAIFGTDVRTAPPVIGE